MREFNFYSLRAVLIIFMLWPVCIVGKKFKRMEKFHYETFKKHYYNKSPVIIRGLKPYLSNTSTNLFRLCGTQQVNLRRMPDLRKAETVSLNQAVHPCGADCYGIYKETVCKDFLDNLTLPEDASFLKLNDVTMTISHESVETPKVVLDTAQLHYHVAGVEEWRVLQHYYGEVDLFSQEYYNDKLTPGEVLYLPPNSLSQHRSLTMLSISLDTTVGTAAWKSIEVEMLNGELLNINI